MIEKFVKYMRTYIELLTKGRKEYFIAIVDIEKKLVDGFLKLEADYATERIFTGSGSAQ